MRSAPRPDVLHAIFGTKNGLMVTGALCLAIIALTPTSIFGPVLLGFTLGVVTQN